MKFSETLLEQFESATLPKSQWTHDAHVRVGLAMLSRYPFDEAVCRLRAGIISLNKAHQTANTASSGYHETLTHFWATAIHLFLTRTKDKSIDSLESTFLKSGLAANTLPFQFYEKEAVLNSDHRSRFIPPTKLSLDWENLSKFLNP